MRFKPILSAVALLGLSACATADFKAETWRESSSTASRTDVESFLRQHIATYDTMISDLEQGKAALEWPIVPLAVVGATAVALGSGGDIPVVFGGAAAGLSGASNYVRPRDRMGFVVQARGAVVCVHRQYAEQVRLALALGYLVQLNDPIDTSGWKDPPKGRPNFNNQRLGYLQARARGGSNLALGTTDSIYSLAAASVQVADVGSIAVGGAEQIVDKLKLRLSSVGSAPDYSTILTDLRQRFETARDEATQAIAEREKRRLAKTLAADPTDAQLRTIAEYSARVAECVAKVP